MKSVLEASVAFFQAQVNVGALPTHLYISLGQTIRNAIDTIRYERNEDLMDMQMKAVRASEESLGNCT